MPHELVSRHVHHQGRARVHLRGENAAFPPDIPVAKVKEVSKRQGDLEPTVLLQPLADLDDITYVKVLRWPEPKGG